MVNVRRIPPWAELVQLLPVVSLALPFVVSGSVDLRRATQGFLWAALLSLPIMGVLLGKRYLLNPILVGTNLWLWLGAAAFNLKWGFLSAWLSELQAAGLFAAVLLVGLLAIFIVPAGFIGSPSPNRSWVRRTSWLLLALTVLAFAWAYTLRDNIRLGGGLPFIVLNVVRRVLMVRGDKEVSKVLSAGRGG